LPWHVPPSRVDQQCASLIENDRKHNNRAGEVVERGHGQSVVPIGDAFAEHAVDSETDCARHHDGVAFERRRALRHAGFSGEKGNPCECQRDAKELAQRRLFEAKNYSEH